MARKTAQNSTNSAIAKVNRRTLGYKIEDVDSFLNIAHSWYEQDDKQLTQQFIQNASFELVKGGYAIEQVDAALMRLERAVVDKMTASQIHDHGRVAYRAKTENLLKDLEHIVDRQEKQRFRPARAKKPAYDRKQVDELIDNIILKAKFMLGLIPEETSVGNRLLDLNATAVSNVIFTQRKGQRGYDERQVDYYLNACIQLLSRIESYIRYSEADDVNGMQMAHTNDSSSTTVNAEDTHSQHYSPDAPIQPLIAQSKHSYNTSSDHMVESAAMYAASNAAQVGVPTVGNGVVSQVQNVGDTNLGNTPSVENKDDFTALQEAEQAIFIDQSPVDGSDKQNRNSYGSNSPLTVDITKTVDNSTRILDNAQSLENAKQDKQQFIPNVDASSPFEETQQFNPLTDFADQQSYSTTSANQSSSKSSITMNDDDTNDSIANMGTVSDENTLSIENYHEPAPTNGSLAALAQMAQNLQEVTLSNTNSFEVHIPDLTTPQVSHFVNANVNNIENLSNNNDTEKSLDDNNHELSMMNDGNIGEQQEIKVGEQTEVIRDFKEE